MAKTTIRLPMPANQRAKQFAMFDAMKGLTEAIAERERQYYSKKELTPERIEEINRILSSLQAGERITVEYYCQYSRQYRTFTGEVKKIDPYWKSLQVGNLAIDFCEIYDCRLLATR